MHGPSECDSGLLFVHVRKALEEAVPDCLRTAQALPTAPDANGKTLPKH